GSTDNVGVVNWTWSFDYLGQDVVLHGQLTEFTFDRAGKFNVSLTVLDAVGLNATDHLTIKVMDLTAPVANAGEDILADQGERVELNGSLSSDTTGIVNWTWSFVHAGSPVEVYGEVAGFTFEIVGVYEVLLRVEDGAGNHDVDTVTVTVRDSTPPVADPGPDRTVDEDTTITFDGSGSTDNVGIVSYEWDFELDGQTITLEGAGPSYTFTTPGEYAVTLGVSDGEGNRGEATMMVTVLDRTSPEAEAGTYLQVDQGDTVTLDGSASSDNGVIVSYAWTFEHGGGTVTLAGKTSPYVFEEAGVFIVTLTVTDGGGNTDEDEATVTVRDITPPVIPDIGDRTVDQGSVVTVHGTGATDNVAVTSYAWSFVYDGNPVHRDGGTLDHTFHIPGVYEITLTVGDAEGNSA
ncbi:MAG: PKD domain-containing protein, partial [Thermoplasmata archaeon]|nr:PKD domain-containing protein [Thermoplasmata archaeon]NIT78345.1 PKD domain-containing protein [Thermoplasmata archaeon]NIU50912.1 PKD domain-containing protein [Thermoplasmata archaeon]NIV79665.1 PKD domain-containing protein [Thermoplasmata archaeon]NIW83777.1 PKD domain-containing protein [Thermoplasmata archaeon]